MMYRLSDVIREHDGKNALRIKVREAEVLSLWEQVVGPEIAESTAPKKISNGTLFVITKSPSWAQELKALGTTIKRQINEAAGSEVVKEIRFSHADFNKEKSFDNSVELPDIKSIELEEKERELIYELASPVKDDQLKRSIVEAITRNKKLDKWRSKNGWSICEKCNGLFSSDNKECTYCG